jgi:murein L,D-transpeptidase YafK
MMIQQIHNVIIKDKIIANQQTQIAAFGQELKEKENDIDALQKKIEMLEQKLFALRTEPADKVLIEKEERRLTLLSKGEVIKRYKIALGGNPVGPKERQGDHKTPEGTYIIDSRNRNSGYHLSLHISYPNEQDKTRAKKLGVSPGGDIMIHGIKNGLSWVGGSHADVDWTKGCIAVTDEEMEEIYQLVPTGTVVEIRP